MTETSEAPKAAGTPARTWDADEKAVYRFDGYRFSVPGWRQLDFEVVTAQ